MASEAPSTNGADGDLQAETVTRVFEHDQLELPDPDPDMTPEQVREHYATQYPALSNARVQAEGISDGTQVFSFERSIGTKG